MTSSCIVGNVIVHQQNTADDFHDELAIEQCAVAQRQVHAGKKLFAGHQNICLLASDWSLPSAGQVFDLRRITNVIYQSNDYLRLGPLTKVPEPHKTVYIWIVIRAHNTQ